MFEELKLQDPSLVLQSTRQTYNSSTSIKSEDIAELREVLKDKKKLWNYIYNKEN